MEPLDTRAETEEAHEGQTKTTALGTKWLTRRPRTQLDIKGCERRTLFKQRHRRVKVAAGREASQGNTKHRERGRRDTTGDRL